MVSPSRARALAPCLASATLAALAAAALALRNAPRADELHTLAHLHHADLASLWRSYRRARDTLPPAGYVLAWAWAKLAGTGLVAARVPVVASWAVAAGATSALTRRSGPWASFAAGLVPSATALVFLGAFARPYAPAFACFVVAVVCWQRAADAGRWGAWAVASLGLAAASTLLHYASAAGLVVVAVATFLPADGRRDLRTRGRAAALALGAVAPLLASAALLPGAVADQGRLPRSVRAQDAATFWPSTTRPAWPVAAGLLLVVLGGLLVGRHRSPRPAPGHVDGTLLALGAALAVVVPTTAVAAMAATSGTYVHRYAVSALLGAALLVAGATERLGRRHALLAPLVAVGLVVGVAAAAHDAAGQLVSVEKARSLPGALGLERSDRDDLVLVADEYDFALLRTYGPAPLRPRLRLGVEPTVAGSPPRLAAATLLRRGDPFEVVAARPDLDALLARAPGWRVDEVLQAAYVRPGVPRQLVHARLHPPGTGP